MTCTCEGLQWQPCPSLRDYPKHSVYVYSCTGVPCILVKTAAVSWRIAFGQRWKLIKVKPKQEYTQGMGFTCRSLLGPPDEVGLNILCRRLYCPATLVLPPVGVCFMLTSACSTSVCRSRILERKCPDVDVHRHRLALFGL